MQHQSTIKAQRHARDLRAGMTDSERLLWAKLRAEQLGVKFRRHHPLGPYIADFACLVPALIVELDGSQHAMDSDYDAQRDDFFKAHGFAVLSFPTDAPFRNMAGVLQVILEQLTALARDAPTPALPQRRRESMPGAHDA